MGELNRHPAAPAWVLARDVLLLGGTWGSSLVLQRLALAQLQPLPLVALRLVCALLFFLPVLPRVRRGLAVGPGVLLAMAVVGALNPAGSALFSALALQFASAGLVAVLSTLAPLFVALLARFSADEPPLRPGQLAGLGLAFGGVALLIATRSTGLAASNAGDVLGYLFGLAVPLSIGLAAVVARRHLRSVDPLASAAGQMAAGLVFVLPVQVLAGDSVAVLSLGVETWLAVLLSGALGLGASFVLLASMIRRHGPTGALTALFVVPLTAASLGVLMLGETLSPPLLLGGALVLGGVSLFARYGPEPPPTLSP